MKPLEFKISISVENYNEKTAENYWNCYVTEKRIVPKLSKISIPNFNNILIEDLNEDCVKISPPYLLYFPKKNGPRALRFGWAALGRFIVLNDSPSPKRIIIIYFNFFQFFENVSELFLCHRDDPYKTANRNFVRFSRSCKLV